MTNRDDFERYVSERGEDAAVAREMLDDLASGTAERGRAECWYEETQGYLGEPTGECENSGKDGVWQRFVCVWRDEKGNEIERRTKFVCRIVDPNGPSS